MSFIYNFLLTTFKESEIGSGGHRRLYSRFGVRRYCHGTQSFLQGQGLMPLPSLSVSIEYHTFRCLSSVFSKFL